MVVGAFPAAKLGVLALKQVSKPIANIIKTRAKQSPFFRKYICMPPAQFYNWMEIKTKMWVMNLGKPANIPKLNEAMAIELGANLLGEVVIFVVGAGVLVFEYVRQSNKEAKREEIIAQEKKELLNSLRDIQFNVERQDMYIRSLQRTVAELDSRTWFPKKFRILSGNDSSDEQTLSHQIETRLENKTNDNFTGNYNPNRNLIFKALNMIENEIFSSDNSERTDDLAAEIQFTNGVVGKALVYLQYFQ